MQHCSYGRVFGSCEWDSTFIWTQCVCTVRLNIETHRVLSTQCIRVFHMILIADSDYETLRFTNGVRILCDPLYKCLSFP
jgi:hypothetical protein